MAGFIARFAEGLHEQIDPSYQLKKEETRKQIQQFGLISTASFVLSVAFAIFGIALTASSGLGAFFGFPIIFVALPTCYFSYNASKALTNFNDIINNPKEYLDLLGSPDKPKIKKKLEERTFGFNWIIDFVVDGTAKKVRAAH